MTEKKYLDFAGLQDYDERIKNKITAEISEALTGGTGVVTDEANGLMSSTDKVKLDGIAAGADAVSFSQEQSSGIKVGTITINGDDTDLYAPNDKELIRDTVGWIGKNLFNSNATSETAQGVTWTVNADKTITVSGTPTDFKEFKTTSDKILPAGTYKLYGISDTTNVLFNRLSLYKNEVEVRFIASGSSISGGVMPEGFEFEILPNDDYDTIVLGYKRGTNNVACSGTIRTMVTKASVTDTTYEPYHEPVIEYVQNIAHDYVEDTVGWTGKNLLPNKAVSGTDNGVDYTVNSDGSILANGTASNQSWGYLNIANLIIKKGKYILSGCPSGGSTGTYFLKLSFSNTPKGSEVTNGIDVGEGALIDLDSDMYVRSYSGIVVQNGITISNKTFYPMLRKADIIDSIYEPYHDSVKETLQNAEVIKGKNLAKPYIYSGVSQTVNITYDGNGYVYLNGTAAGQGSTPASAWVPENGKFLLPAGTYTASTTDSDLNIEVVAFDPLEILNSSSNTFTITTDRTVFVREAFNSGKVFTNKKVGLQLEVGTKATSFEPYYIPLKDSKYSRSEANLLGSKNLNQTNYKTRTLSGITFVNNGDGTVTISGTSTAEVTDGGSVAESFVAPFDAQVILSGGIDNNRHIYPWDCTNNVRPWKDSSKTVRHSGNVGTDETSFWMEKDVSYCMILRVRNNENVSTPQTFKPLLRLATDSDDTYVPPAKTNYQLTVDKADKLDTAVNKELTDEDLNSIKTPGFYNASGSNTCTNKPSGSTTAFGLQVIHSATGEYYTQIYYNLSSTVSYRRNCNNGTWGSWVEEKITDTLNTTGSTDTSSKIFLIGATSQAANPQTYSDNEVYATNGVLTTKSVQVGGTSATMQYNSTNKCIDFVFA